METIFDIFGSCDSINQSAVNSHPQKISVTKNILSEGVLPGKQTVKNGGIVGKKVLSDVGNKINGLNKKPESTTQGTFKKPVQANSAPKISANRSCENSDKVQLKKNVTQLNSESSLNSINIDDFPETEIQGSSFWGDDHYGSTWLHVDMPSIEDFCRSANMWDLEMKPYKQSSPSPPIEDFDICLDLPTASPCLETEKMVLEEVSINFPWEM